VQGRLGAATIEAGRPFVLAYLIQLGHLPFRRRADVLIARNVARVFGRRSRAAPSPCALKALSRRRLGLIRFGGQQA
jgi:hypothetical protein